MKKGANKIVASAITLIILASLIISGPAQAFSIGLTILDNYVEKGESISFTASVEIEDRENLNITNLVLELKGMIDYRCKFNFEGEIIEGCNGTSIERISVPHYGYGYGYGYGFTDGTLAYNITLNTSYYLAGTYETYLSIFISEESFSHRGEDIRIKAKPSTLEGCSVRAGDSKLIAEGKDFGEGKLNFHVPLGNAENGKGSLTGKKNRVSYKFDVAEILENNENYAVVLVSGKYRINLEKRKQEVALIFLDKKIKKASLVGDDIKSENMDVNFMKKC